MFLGLSNFSCWKLEENVLCFYLLIFFFPDEPGKQVKSAVKIKNTSKSYVAFKVIFPC